MGKPIAQGVLPNGETYWDYTLQPLGYHNYRVTFAPDERVQAVQDLLNNQNIARIEPGIYQFLHEPASRGEVDGRERLPDHTVAAGAELAQLAQIAQQSIRIDLGHLGTHQFAF